MLEITERGCVIDGVEDVVYEMSYMDVSILISATPLDSETPYKVAQIISALLGEHKMQSE